MFGIRIKGVCDIMKKYVQEATDINIWTSRLIEIKISEVL